LSFKRSIPNLHHETNATDKMRLLLVPTLMEIEHLRPLLDSSWKINPVGFGLVESAINTARWIDEMRPEQIFHAGIAGTFDCMNHPIGSAVAIGRLYCDGIGVGSGADFRSALEMGWQTEKSQSVTVDVNQSAAMVSAAAASADASDAARRARRFPGVVGEDMESFAVARTSLILGVPITVVRGFSNEVGNRDASQWQIAQALGAAAEMLKKIVA
jgi:futalosine hydrolase